MAGTESRDISKDHIQYDRSLLLYDHRNILADTLITSAYSHNKEQHKTGSIRIINS